MSDTWTIAVGDEQTIDVDGVADLKIALVGGRVDVIAHDEPGARVEVTGVTGKELSVSVTDGRLIIDHPQVQWDDFLDTFRRWRGRARAHVSVAVPRRTAVRLGVVTADALVTGLEAEARLSTVAGTVTTDELVGDVDVNSVNGEVSVLDHTGRVHVHTVSGDVTVTGPVDRLEVDTVAGDVFLDATAVPDRVEARTVAGDVTARMPQAPARYSVRTLTGTVLVDDTRHHAGRGRAIRFATGTLTGRWTGFAIKTVSGDVTVLHTGDADAPPAPEAETPAEPEERAS